ncbi:MAG TPA: response regulator transcription factor [Gaiellaceae bacterium]
MRGTRERSAVLLDRHPLWLDAMEKLLVTLGVEVSGRASDADEAVELVREHRPDLFIAGVDVSSPEQVTCIKQAKQVHPEVKAVVVDDTTKPEEIDVAFAAGAVVYCVKTATQDDLASAIRQAFERSIFLASNGTTAAAPAAAVTTDAPATELTRREHEILKLVAEGYSNSQLAKMLWVTEQTVKFHLSNIYRKLDVANRTEASRWAQVHGLLPAHRDAEMTPSAA